MADFVHLAPERHARRMRRTGISARSRGRSGDRGVYLMPVLPDFTSTFQWVRELRRWHPGVLMAVLCRLPDDEPVTVGRYSAEPVAVGAAEAVAVVRGLDDPRGYEVFLPRGVRAGEVRRVQHVRPGVGWRYLPDAHGRAPCACPVCLGSGQFKAADIRRRFSQDDPRPTKPELMAALRAARSADDIVHALWGLGGRSRGGAEELAYLVGHPEPEVREVLAEVLEWYRGPAARALRAELALRQEAASEAAGGTP